MGLFEYEKLKQHGLIPDAPEITKSRTPASKVRKSRCKVNKTIVKGGKRMGTPIRKYQETYYVPMAWIGIIELRQTSVNRGNSDPRGISNDTTYTFNGFERDIPTKLGNVTVSITMYVKQVYGGEFIREAGREALRYLKENGMIPKDMYIDTIEEIPEYRELFEQYRDNMIENMKSGVMEVCVDGGFTYTVPATGKNISWEGYEYRSVEEFIDAVTQASEEKMNEFSQLFDDEMERYNAKIAEKEALNRVAPETIRIDFGGDSFEIYRHDSARGGFTWYSPYSEGYNVSEEGVSFSSSVRINEEVDDSAGGYREGVGNVRYHVYVYNAIIDNNTRIGGQWEPNTMDAEGWERNFEAETGSLDDAIATASNFVRETYDEWKAYVQSARDYQERSRGRGLKRETVNANEWIYYDSDSPDYVDPDVVYKSKRKNRDVTDMNGFELNKLKQHGMIEKSKVKKFASMNYMSMDIEKLVEDYEHLDNLYHEVVDSGAYELSDNEPRLYHAVESAIDDAIEAIRDYIDYLEHY